MGVIRKNQNRNSNGGNVNRSTTNIDMTKEQKVRKKQFARQSYNVIDTDFSTKKDAENYARIIKRKGRIVKVVRVRTGPAVYCVYYREKTSARRSRKLSK